MWGAQREQHRVQNPGLQGRLCVSWDCRSEKALVDSVEGIPGTVREGSAL